MKKLLKKLFSKSNATHSTRSNFPPLKFHNTFSGKLEHFVPLTPGLVKMYNCGPTVYDRQHIGNLLPPSVFNILRNTLEYWGYKVRQVNNITDVGHLTPPPH